ncbi:hypothetical protein [Streptomyces sp. NBC_00986]|uniref:hypothetical protein n=1 Tax=Streptomyces sp. NBC_00986 TaxID=2903702 RepID=UPI00386B0C29|nr:hypothetical protein OG504_45305 [Streptomyces sp. NBC_00986]
MNASSQTPGPMPPASPPAATPEQVREVFAAYDVALPVPAGTTYADPWEQNPDVPYSLRSPFPEPATPQCCTCGLPAGSARHGTPLRPDPAGHRYPSGAQVLYCFPHLPAAAAEVPVSVEEAAAAGVLDAVRAQNAEATSLDLAAAEARAGILFDATHVQEAVDAAAAQARAETQAELTELHTQLATLAGAHRRVQAVLRLCEGRHGDDMLLVSAVAVAAESGTTALDGLPMTLTWTGRTEVHPTRGRASVECTSSYGGRADLVLTDEQCASLARQLTPWTVRDLDAKCETPGCGAAADAQLSDLFGWSRLEIASLRHGPRWYCCDMCVFDALARAGHELAAADDLDARYGVGASDEHDQQVAEAIDSAFDDERGDVDEADGQAETGGDL